MAEPLVLREHRDDVPGTLLLTLNRPEARNALSRALFAELDDAFRSAQADADVRIVVLTGAGAAFSAGVDLREAAEAPSAPRDGAEPWRRPACWDAMAAFEGPIIGAINGPAVTGGLEIALACDVLVASTNARFADTHVRVGIVPGAGASQLLARAVGIYRAKYLSLTGNFLSAEQAAQWGLVSHVVAPEDLLPTALRIAADMASAPPSMLAAIKRVMDDGFALPLGEALALEAERSAAHIAKSNAWAGAGASFEGVRDRGRAQQTPDAAKR